MANPLENEENKKHTDVACNACIGMYDVEYGRLSALRRDVACNVSTDTNDVEYGRFCMT